MAADEPLATLIGDLVASKQHDDRRALQRLLASVLTTVNARSNPVQPLELTVGDEFQGGFASVPEAARASLLVRLELLVHKVDSRYGLGHGAVTVFDRTRSPVSQDGPGWWAARAAIDRAKQLADSPRTSFARTCFGYGQDEAPGWRGDAAAFEAFLLCRDATIEQTSERARRLLLGLMIGKPQAELAAEEGITQGAVSQNLRRSGAFAIEAAHLRLENAPS